MILVSACLLGLSCRYDGGHNLCPALLGPAAAGLCLPVCPEQLGGLPTPRPAAEIVGGSGQDVLAGRAKILAADGLDLTPAFLGGVRQTLALVRAIPIAAAVLKARSPTCGVGRIYDGSFTRVVKDGDGVAAAALAEKGIPLYTEEDLTAEELQKILALGAGNC
ncbi:DUF523 domain-containing protein [Anaeroselena agilis]|uniref:DUF523 domain-containing protein n=1 Tax=Anaeroselena agilis TaxID=3063788 RepID=A0ABU3P1F1_9FIRM|nr:DUF523 domain-containing protein [Selenomonadales bacterium 4137-cl]